MTVTSNNDEVRRMIILDQGTDTELGIVGLGYSPDNGTHFFVTNTIKGRVFRKQDVETLWPLLKDKIQNVMDGSLSVSWADIQNKPDVALRSELPDMSNYVTHDQLPAPVDLSGYAKIGDIPSLNGYAKLTDIPSIAGLVKEAELDNYVKKGEIPEVDLSGYAKITDLIGYAKTSDIPTDVVTHAELANATPKIDASLKYMSKKPSDYTDGIFYEEKYISTMGIDRSSLDSSAQTGTYGLVTTKVMTINGTKFARQQCEVIDSQRPITFLRNGYSNSWSSWEVNTTLAF